MKKTLTTLYFPLVIILTFTILMAFIVPELYVYLKLEPFSWQNSWDKCTYFSYQGILGTRNMPGTFLLWIIGWAQELGIAGSTQTLILDLLLPLLSVFFLYKTFHEFKFNKAIALAYATIILFASVLFNFCNPTVASHFPIVTHFDFFLVGMEGYPSILRAPNPQFSYFLLSLCIYLASRYKKNIFLLLPIPFLYYFVLIPYAYLLAILFFLFKTNIVRSYLSLILVHFFVYFTIACGIWCMFMLMGDSLASIKSSSSVFQLGRHLHLNLVGCLGIIIYGVFVLLGLTKNKDIISYLFLSLILCSFAITNMQLVNTLGLDLKDFQDYGNSILGGLILVISMQIMLVRWNLLNFGGKPLGQSLQYLGCFIFLLFIARYTLLSQGFNFNTYNFTINPGATITPEQWKKIKSDPLHAIVLDEQLSELLPFSHSKMLAPVFSYQYQYLFFEKGCSYNQDLAKNAANFIQKNCDNKLDCESLKRRVDAYFSGVEIGKNLPYKNQSYCEKSIYLNKDFYFIKPANNIAVIFPKWSDYAHKGGAILGKFRVFENNSGKG